MTFACVYVSDAVYNMDKAYDYFIAEKDEKKAQPGCRVIVPFGRGNRRRQGIITELKSVCDYEKVKPVTEVIDNDPVLSKDDINLILWMKDKYYCTFFDALYTVLPSGINVSLDIIYTLNESALDKRFKADLPEAKVIKFIKNSNGHVTDSKAKAGLTEIEYNALTALCEDGLCDKHYLAKRGVSDLNIKTVELNSDEEEVEKAVAAQNARSPKQAIAIEALKKHGALSVSEMDYLYGVSPQTLKSLEKKGIIKIYEEESFRPTFDPDKYEGGVVSLPMLSAEQQNVFDGLLEQFTNERPSAALLYGVTASGKTLVYIRLIEEALKSGNGVIICFPEIALSAQMIEVFYRHFGKRIALINSRLSLGERYDEWKRIRAGEADVVIGTRSAIFAPVHNLGLIIIDEEQEHTYKSESSPRYHAKDVARYRCAKSGGMMLLGSATPSLESYHYAVNGRYKLYTLKKRYYNVALPNVEIADISEDFITGNAIGSVLEEEIRVNIEKSEQTVLFLNRRGFHTFISCRMCKTVATCPRCSVALTYHKINEKLICHCCGYSAEKSETCESCGGKYVRYSGAGTQRIEEELSALFPNAKVLRMDADTTSRKYAHERILDKFKDGGYDILIGTQMVTKGLDFPKVSLVGVISADAMLYADHYMAYEQAFSMLTQVIGRAGRKSATGRAVIQTMSPDNPVLTMAGMQDYESFYKGEIALRKIRIYPPFCDICIIVFTSVYEKEAEISSNTFMEAFRKNALTAKNVTVTAYPPVQAGIYKLNNKYRIKILMKCSDDKNLKKALKETLIEYLANPKNKNVSVAIDINPYNNY